MCTVMEALHWTQMADGILKFMISHLGLGSNVQLGLVDFKTETGFNWPTGILQDFKVCDWPLRLVSGGQSQTLKSTRPSWTFDPGPKWPIINFKIPSAI